eukprot:CAMPEP_0195161094 /NCGR_PEP_ID=MMETSP0448-20130528/186994_1 /TAXON_ID=66468 /ORGANISM="Heterocapsa triquestra, Strain CCMP 448" /LENGTH=110 /DNA_ID=CAMNT_0040199895 /DNA_START=219 /DNA_END=552 /DNA_ORIENTATION=+
MAHASDASTETEGRQGSFRELSVPRNVGHPVCRRAGGDVGGRLTSGAEKLPQQGSRRRVPHAAGAMREARIVRVALSEARGVSGANSARVGGRRNSSSKAGTVGWLPGVH